MSTEKDQSAEKGKKEPKIEVRDLKPKKDVKGGASKGGDDKKTQRKTGEIDFMNWD